MCHARLQAQYDLQHGVIWRWCTYGLHWAQRNRDFPIIKRRRSSVGSWCYTCIAANGRKNYHAKRRNTHEAQV